jgi:hypothetical protein
MGPIHLPKFVSNAMTTASHVPQSIQTASPAKTPLLNRQTPQHLKFIKFKVSISVKSFVLLVIILILHQKRALIVLFIVPPSQLPVNYLTAVLLWNLLTHFLKL